MTRIIAVPTAAGSAGKTTTVVSLAAILGARGRRVLVIDADPQGTATEWLGVPLDEPVHDVGSVLLSRVSLAEATLDVETPGVQLVPSSPGLDGDLIELGKKMGPEQRLRRALQDVEADLVLIDCPGAIGPVSLYALVAATACLTVAQPTSKDLKGLIKMEAFIGEVADVYNPGLRLAAIVPCLVPALNQGRLYSDALDRMREDYGELVTPPVRRTTRIPEADSHSVPLPIYAPSEPATADYLAIADWLIEREVM